MHSSNKLLVMPSFKIAVEVTLLCCITLGETASISVTLPSHNIQNGTSMNLIAEFDPTIGSALLSDMSCRYIQPGHSGYTTITRYNTVQKRVMFHTSLSSSQRSRMNITSSGNPMILTISNIIFADEKTTYYCHLIYFDNLGNFQSMDSDNQILENVYSLPTVNDARSIQQSTTLTEGIAANLACVATGRPQLNITWQYNSAIISANSSNVYEGSPLITTTSVLTINYPTQSMNGQQITCFIPHQFSSTMNRTTTLIFGYEPDQVRLTASSLKPTTGSSVTLTCTARASPPASFRFISINGSSETVQDSASATYTISPLDYKKYNNYVASYGCIAYNSFGNSSMQTVVLNIKVGPKISTSLGMTVVEGENVVLYCNVTAANPMPNITWSHPSSGVIPNTNGMILFPSIKRNQHAVYACIASNGVGPAVIRTTSLVVNYGPQLEQNNTEYERCIGERVQIVCNAVGQPLPDVSLFFNRVLLKTNSRSLTYDILVNAMSQFGRYICVANNTVGAVNITTTIIEKYSKTERTSSSLSAAEIAISIIVPLVTVIVIALLIWIFKLKQQVAALSSKIDASSNQTNQAGYMDLELKKGNTDAQPYATITNPGALAYEQIPEVRTQYMELNTLQEGHQPYAKLAKDYEEVGKL